MGKLKGDGLNQTLTPALIETMGAKGMTRQQIGAFFGYSGRRVGQILTEYPELDEAYERGQSKGIEKACGKLMEQIENGNIVAILFYLKCQGKWIEQQYIKEKPVIDIPAVQIFLPSNQREIVSSEIEIEPSL